VIIKSASVFCFFNIGSSIFSAKPFIASENLSEVSLDMNPSVYTLLCSSSLNSDVSSSIDSSKLGFSLSPLKFLRA